MKNLIIAILLLVLTGSFAPIRTEKIHEVHIEGMRFIPKNIEIKVGETVRWINPTSDAHNVADKNDEFRSKMLTKNDVFSYRFTKPGVYNYYCQPHRIMGMKGTVVVK